MTMTPEKTLKLAGIGWKVGSTLALVLVAAAITTGAYSARQAYRVSDTMATAYRTHDGKAVVAHIDFRALRDNLTDELVAATAKQATPLLGKGRAPAVLIRSYVTAMIAAIASPDAVQAFVDKDKQDEDSSEAAPTHLKVVKAFRDWRHFTVQVTDAHKESLTFVYQRDGWVDWKLANVEFPNQAFVSGANKALRGGL